MYKPSMNDIKALRERTGAGIKDCKTALVESNGDTSAAIDWLRQKGIAKAAKKAGRVAAEGAILTAQSETAIALVEVNCETDFVARTDDFKNFSTAVTQLIADTQPADLAALLATDWNGRTVEAAIQEMVVKTGENVNVRRFVTLSANGAKLGSYIHSGARLGTVYAIEGSDSALESDDVNAFATDLGMHLAARRPQFTDINAIPEEVVEKERSIQVARAVEEGKPQNIAEKMVNGRIGKWKKEITLVDQEWIGAEDGSKQTTAEKLAEISKSLGSDVTVRTFNILELGEGVEKTESNLAAEVAAMTKG
jgi:elongation factor Ts